MRRNQFLGIVALIILLIACKKDHPSKPYPDPPSPPPTVPEKKVLLKDITIPHLPSPYYHFEYNSDSMITRADFASGYFIYDVLYSGNRVSEMRNNIIVNHDTLRYVYDNTGKIGLIKFINQSNVVYRHAFFTYNGSQVTKIEWDHKEGNAGFIIDRTLTFTYFSDGNVKVITEHRPGFSTVPDYTSTWEFDQYDDKINVDDFSLIHDGIHDHLFLLSGFRIQRNNPRKEIFSAGPGNAAYTVDYTYTYNSDNTPSAKIGELLYTAGSDAGKRFQTHDYFTYY